jgi:transcriptional regulator with XRE-family HTH domain
MIIDFSELALAPNESRAARNFLGLSQAQVASQSDLPAHKLKRFESGNYVPDAQFLDDLRSFYEEQGYDFRDEESPGAKAKARGDVVPAGVVGKTDGSIGKNHGSSSENQGKPKRSFEANLQFMRINPELEQAQIDGILDCIEDNEQALQSDFESPVVRGFLSEEPNEQTKAMAIACLRRLAENGLMHAKLLGRELLPQPVEGAAVASAKTVGELLQLAFQQTHLAVLNRDPAALKERKARKPPTEVLEALMVG